MFNFDISNEVYEDVEALSLLLNEEAKEKERKAESERKQAEERKSELQQKAFAAEVKRNSKRS